MYRWFHTHEPKLKVKESESLWPILGNEKTKLQELHSDDVAESRCGDTGCCKFKIKTKKRKLNSDGVQLRCGDTDCKFKIKTYLYSSTPAADVNPQLPADISGSQGTSKDHHALSIEPGHDTSDTTPLVKTT